MVIASSGGPRIAVVRSPYEYVGYTGQCLAPVSGYYDLLLIATARMLTLDLLTFVIPVADARYLIGEKNTLCYGVEPNLKKTMLYLVLPVFLMTALFALFAPGYLYSENVPRRADAVVLFIGPGNVPRFDEANQLVKDGYARYLIIPSYDEVRVLNGQGEMERVSGMAPRGALMHKIHMAAEYKGKKYYENTHIEALEAKRMMDDLGLRSVMLVSSAYHMRRIKLIADRVFDARRYDVSCNPARWQPQFTAGDWFDKARRKIIVSEYAKITWFLAYGLAGS